MKKIFLFVIGIIFFNEKFFITFANAEVAYFENDTKYVKRIYEFWNRNDNLIGYDITNKFENTDEYGIGVMPIKNSEYNYEKLYGIHPMIGICDSLGYYLDLRTCVHFPNKNGEIFTAIVYRGIGGADNYGNWEDICIIRFTFLTYTKNLEIKKFFLKAERQSKDYTDLVYNEDNGFLLYLFDNIVQNTK